MKYSVEKVEPLMWRVSSEEEGEVTVVFNGRTLICECGHYWRKHYCNHIHAVIYYLIKGTKEYEV